MDDTTQPVAQFLQYMGRFLRKLVEEELEDSTIEQVSALYYGQTILS